MIGLFTGILLFGAAGTALAAFVVAHRRLVSQLASRFRALPRAQQTLLVFAVGAFVAWAGTKPEGEIIELSNNRIIESVEAAGENFNAKNAKGNNAKSAKTVGSRNAPQKAQLSEGRLRSNGEAARKSPLPRDRDGLEGLVGRDVLGAPQDGISHGVTEARSGSGFLDRINRIDRIRTSSLRASRALARRSAIASGDLPSETLRVSTAHVAPCENAILAADETSLSNPVNLVNPVERNDLLLVRVGTNEVFDFSAPDGATVAEKWRRRGASKDYLRLNFTDWSFPFGGESFSNLVVFAGGRVRLSHDAALRPFAANLGIVPEANWTLLDRINRIDRIDSVGEGSQSSVGRDVLGAPQDEIPSQFWHLLTPSNTLVLTWQNALLNRETANPVSFQAELFPSGNVVFRYDLARIGDDGLLTNVVVGVKGREGLERRQGLEDGDERSRLEVEVENGTVNLLSPPSASTSTSLLFSVPRGQTTPLYLRADATLSVSYSSDDFAFGSLPDLAASRLVGRINFPNVTATTPCFHDYVARQKEVTLPVGADADANKFGLWRF